MHKTMKFIACGVLMMVCAAFAQEKSESVANILKELGSYTGTAKTATESAPANPETTKMAETPAEKVVVETTAAVEEAAPVAEKKSRNWLFFWRKDKSEKEPGVEKTPVAEEPTVSEEQAPAAVTVMEEPSIAAEDVPAVIDESRELYVGGEFEKAQKGFAAVIKVDPENIIARMYLRKIMERGQRKAEVKGMKEVDQAWKTGMVFRSYPVTGNALEKMGIAETEGSIDITAKFPEVDFPKGASAVYQPKMEKIFVRNTRENLTVLEEILDAMDVSNHSTDTEQVEIEAKFVEVSEGTLEELGFEWRSVPGAAIGRPAKDINTGLDGNDITIPEGSFLFDSSLRGGIGNDNIANPLPFSRSGSLAAGNGVDAESGDWTAFRFEDTFNTTADYMTLEHRGSTPLDVLISALDQSSGTDVLSAPRIVTKSGETATIRVGQLHYYPEVYEVGANEGNILYVSYEDFSEKLLGVEMEVTPKVDGDQIELGLNPKINELQGWQNYTIAPANSAYTYYQFRMGFEFEHDAIVARLPVFKKREVETEVTIADGSTIGMGGLISEKVESYEDKVPVLGSLPLVGRLFRNEGERAVKRNLMIFVTAKKVEPTGRINTARSFE